jgi:hypothetical protein
VLKPLLTENFDKKRIAVIGSIQHKSVKCSGQSPRAPLYFDHPVSSHIDNLLKLKTSYNPVNPTQQALSVPCTVFVSAAAENTDAPSSNDDPSLVQDVTVCPAYAYSLAASLAH